MQRILGILLSALLLLSLFAACSRTPSPDTTGNPSPVTNPVDPDASASDPSASNPVSSEAPEAAPASYPSAESLDGLWIPDAVLDEEHDATAWLRFRLNGTADYTDLQSGTMIREIPVSQRPDSPVSFGDENTEIRVLSAEEDAITVEITDDDGIREERFLLASSGTDFLGRPLTESELSELTEHLSFEENGFFVCSYDRPEEIDWHEVCYNGAGINRTPTETDYEYFEATFGEVFGDVEMIYLEDLENFVLEKTGTPYELARKPLQWYTETGNVFLFDHGDTNYQPIEFLDGYVDGYEYLLVYGRYDWQNWGGYRYFVMSARIQDGKWTYHANYLATAPEPRTLLTIDYYETREEAEQAGAGALIDHELSESDEPNGICWALITAQADGVRCDIDHALPQVADQYDVYVPGEVIYSDVMNRGESFAIQVNQPWHPELRVTASLGEQWGEYYFGEDNYLHLPFDAQRYITGHDLTAEGRGCLHTCEEDLARFLMDGVWAYLDEETGKVLGSLKFYDYRGADICIGENYYPLFLDYETVNADSEAPDMLHLSKSYNYDAEGGSWDTLPEFLDPEDFGRYYCSCGQWDGEQILFLNAQGLDSALSWMLTGSGETQNFQFHRYRGTTEFEPVG